MNKLYERFMKWNKKRLDKSENYDIAYAFRHPVDIAAFRHTAEEFDIPYKVGHMKDDPNVKVFLCYDYGRLPEDKALGFAHAMNSKCEFTHKTTKYTLFRAQLWKFD